jgi:redox-sensing transcriptional repressor
MNAEKIPDIIIGRLPVYLRALQRMADNGIKTTSSQELGEHVGISAAQIRKDISQFGEFGKQGTGYSIAYLLDKLREILKVDRLWDVALVGAGDMGHALARYQGFTNRGFHIVMIFDNDKSKVGQKIDNFRENDRTAKTCRGKNCHAHGPCTGRAECCRQTRTGWRQSHPQLCTH